MLLLDLGWFESGLRVIMAWLCSFIYKLIASLFELFINISKVELLSSEEITPIYQRVTMILTIVMVFYVTFELVKYIIQPDTMKDKEKGASKVVVRMILVVVLIAFVPTAFRLAYRLQNAIIEREVLSKVILGKSNTSSESFGRNFSADMFSLFYSFDEEYWDGSQECDDVDCEQLVDGNINTLRSTGKLENLTYGLNETETKTENGISQDIALIRFDGLFAVLVGGFLVYVLILYCIDLGVRVAQITFLQIIAPIPIIGYLSPKKDNIFNKWVKQCTTTYLDLFIRLSLIYFVLLVCKIIADAYNNGTLIQNVDQESKTFVYIAIIMGLLLFAQKAPKMLQELFPKMGAASGNFGLKGKDRMAPIAAKTAAKAIGMGTGLARGLVRAGVARGKNINDRNKKLKEQLRKEGKATDRRSMRHARNEAKNKAKESKQALKQKDRELSKAETELSKAEKKLRQAEKKGDGVEAAKAEVAAAKAKYDNVRTGVKVKGTVKELTEEKDRAKTKSDQATERLRNAESKKALAQQAFDNATTDDEKEKAKAELDKANKEFDEAKKDKNIADKELNDITESLEYNKGTKSYELLEKAKNDLEEAKTSGNQAEIAKAQRRLEQAEARYDLEQRTGYLGMQAENISAQSALADERNQSYGAYTGFRVAGAAIKGAVTGAAAGAHAKKLSYGEIKKQTDEGLKKINKSEADYMQYLQDGGSATISGTIDRAVTHAEQRAGIRTEAERYKYQVKDIEDQIKLKKSEAEKETQVKTYLDSAKNRSGQKIDAGEQKIEVGEGLEGITDSQRNSISWSYALGLTHADNTPVERGEELDKSKYMYDANGNKRTTSSMLESIREQENRAINEAETANRLFQEAQSNGLSENDPKYKVLKDNAERKAAEAEERKTISKLARKKLLEYGVSKAIQGDRSDNILYDTVQSLKNAIDVNRNIPAARDHVRKGIAARFGGEDTEGFRKVWHAFIYNDVKDYQDVDVIEGLLTNHVGILNNEASSLKAQADRISESSVKGAADAAAAGGSSNK